MKTPRFHLIFLLLCLGYFIDYYDLTLFAVARPAILKDLGVLPSQSMAVSQLMFNAQAAGIFLGGIVSGLWGDKIGRVSAIRAGILLYSVAILVNVFVHSLAWFATCRFFAGIGLAGELAASVTLLSEMTPHANRGLLSSIVYCAGVLGGMLTTFICTVFTWKTLFFIGSAAGFLLLLLRATLVDSALFIALKENSQIQRGSLKALLMSKRNFLKIIRLSLLLMPMWFGVFFLNYAPEVAKGLGLKDKVHLPTCLFLFFVGSLLGALGCSYLGKLWQSRKKTIAFSISGLSATVILLCTLGSHNGTLFTYLYVLTGMSSGYFGVYMAFLAESFGTNQRSTGTTLVSNLGRSSFIAINSLVPMAIQFVGGMFGGALLSTGLMVCVSMAALWFSKETYEVSLDWVE